MVYLVTGKAGAGKTTYAFRLAEELRSLGWMVKVLDSEKEREKEENQDFSEDGRYGHLFQLSLTASSLEEKGCVVIVSALSPTKRLRDMMRLFWEKSFVVFIPGGELWPGTTYEIPGEEELRWRAQPPRK